MARARSQTTPVAPVVALVEESDTQYQKVPLAHVFAERASKNVAVPVDQRSAAAAAELDDMLGDLGI